MTEFSIVHEFSTDPATFWNVFFDAGYNQEFYRSAGVVRHELERRDDARVLTIVARYSSDIKLPGFVRAALGNRDLGYVETCTFHKDRGLVEQLVEPTVMPDRTRFNATIALTPVGAGRLRRSYSGAIDVDVPLIGRRIEAGTIKGMREMHETAAAVTRTWLAKAA